MNVAPEYNTPEYHGLVGTHVWYRVKLLQVDGKPFASLDLFLTEREWKNAGMTVMWEKVEHFSGRITRGALDAVAADFDAGRAREMYLLPGGTWVSTERLIVWYRHRLQYAADRVAGKPLVPDYDAPARRRWRRR